jgi:signal transduction histidine kinase
MPLNRQQAPPLATPQVPATTPAPVTITISPLEWRTLPFGGVPTLLAIRQVQTPDGALAQGFVVDRAALASWLATRAGDMVAELHPDDSRGATIAPGWGLTVEPAAHTLGQAAADASAVARAFLIRFIGIGSIAALTAASVLVLVMRAEKLALERSQFAAAAAHELRTPLTGLQLYGDMLAEGLGDPGKMRDYARRMSEDASRLGRVVSNMLGFSQLERDNLSVDAQVGPLGQVLREIAERAEPALTRAGAALELDVTPELRARFDRDALAQIVGNLLDNAEKYARDAENRAIRLAAFPSGDVVEVTVEDHGPGIIDRTKLFRAFSRGVNSSDRPAGLGLGLALSMSLARAMGGELTYRPRDGGGATFVLQLPRA